MGHRRLELLACRHDVCAAALPIELDSQERWEGPRSQAGLLAQLPGGLCAHCGCDRDPGAQTLAAASRS